MEKNKVFINYPSQIEVPEWWSTGFGVSYRRDALPANHPEQTYNYIKRVYDVEPEQYGIYHPYHEKYENYTKEELMSRVCELENNILSMERYLF